jgi:hypothetical protein
MNNTDAFAYDREIAAALNKHFAAGPPPVVPERGDESNLAQRAMADQFQVIQSN